MVDMIVMSPVCGCEGAKEAVALMEDSVKLAFDREKKSTGELEDSIREKATAMLLVDMVMLVNRTHMRASRGDDEEDVRR